MRTKTLLLTAALSVAGIAASNAQVYSVNAVGYVNVSVALAAGPFTYAIIANPLNAANNNQLSTVVPDTAPGTSLYFFRNGTFESSIYAGGAVWLPDTQWNPGEAAFIEIPEGSPNPTVITFVGEVPQGHLVNPIPTGYALRSSMVPQAGLITTDLKLNANAGNQVYLFRNGTYESAIALGDGTWLPSEPNVAVGEGFFTEVLDEAGYDWVRDFSVNNP